VEGPESRVPDPDSCLAVPSTGCVYSETYEHIIYVFTSQFDSPMIALPVGPSLLFCPERFVGNFFGVHSSIRRSWRPETFGWLLVLAAFRFPFDKRSTSCPLSHFQPSLRNMGHLVVTWRFQFFFPHFIYVQSLLVAKQPVL